MSTENPNRLAVGYLATPSGNDGVALASAIAAKIGAALDLICVVQPIPYDGQPGLEQYMERLENQAAEWLSQGASHVPDGIEVRTVVTVNESFTEGLIDVAEQSGDDVPDSCVGGPLVFGPVADDDMADGVPVVEDVGLIEDAHPHPAAHGDASRIGLQAAGEHREQA